MGNDVKRMCKWNKKKLKDSPDAFAKMVKKPTHVCTKCLRVANNKKNLCDSQSLAD